jgi:hypothetical protein
MMTSSTDGPPWQREDWAAAANEANRGLNGQGYIVHSMMKASRSADRLGWFILALMVLQIAIASWQVFRCSP